MARHPGLPVLRLTTNVGYCGGNNPACAIAQAAGAAYALVLNNDTIVEPGFLDTLARFTEEHPEVVLVTPKITWYHSRDTIWFARGSYSPWRGYPTVHGRRQRDGGRFDAVRQMTFATGCWRFAFDRLGRRDPIHSGGVRLGEDVELCLHVLRNDGKGSLHALRCRAPPGGARLPTGRWAAVPDIPFFRCEISFSWRAPISAGTTGSLHSRRLPQAIWGGSQPSLYSEATSSTTRSNC